MNSPFALHIKDLSIHFGGHVAVNRVTCSFVPGELTAIVGPNGAGKTTLFNLVSGQLPASSGTVVLGDTLLNRMSPSRRARHGIGRAFQLTNLFPRLENVRLAVQAQAGDGMRMLVRARSLRHLGEEAQFYLEQTRLKNVAHLAASALSHGDQRKLEVAMLLAMKPDVFMFDEPTAGMSIDEAPAILDLIEKIRQDKTKIVLLVEHKMDVVRALADRIIVLHNGKLVAEGKPEEVIALPIVREIYLGTPA